MRVPQASRTGEPEERFRPGADESREGGLGAAPLGGGWVPCQYAKLCAIRFFDPPTAFFERCLLVSTR